MSPSSDVVYLLIITSCVLFPLLDTGSSSSDSSSPSYNTTDEDS